MLGFLFIPSLDEPAVGLICKLQDGRVGKIEEIKEFHNEQYCNINLFYQGKDETISVDITELTVVEPKYVTDEIKENDTITYYEDLEDLEELTIESILPVDTKNLEEGLKDDVEVITKEGASFLKSQFGLCWYKEVKCGICH